MIPLMKPQVRKFSALLESAGEGGYIAKCLELPVTTEGESKAEAIRNVREAVEGYLEVRAEILGKSKSRKQLVEIAVKQTPSPVLA